MRAKTLAPMQGVVRRCVFVLLKTIITQPSAAGFGRFGDRADDLLVSDRGPSTLKKHLCGWRRWLPSCRDVVEFPDALAEGARPDRGVTRAHWRSKTSATGFSWGCLLGGATRGMWGRMFAAQSAISC